MISSFRGPYAWLSNFHPCDIQLDGVVYPSVEHAFQASKTISPVERALIHKASTPGKAKRIGGTVTIRSNWDRIKQGIMLGLLFQKFQHPHLAWKLLNTGTQFIIEGNDYGDTYWGVCNGVGENYLGRLLMLVRSQLLAELQQSPSVKGKQ